MEISYVKCNIVASSDFVEKKNSFLRCILASIFCASLHIVPSASLADVESMCDSRPGAISYLETMKNDFYFGKYHKFISEVDAYSKAPPQELENLEGLLSKNFRNGFSSCTTLVTELISDRLVSEIVLFEPAVGNAVFVSWVALSHNGQWAVVKYAVTTEFETAKSVWR